MDRAYEKSLGTALVAIGLGLLLYGFVQAYDYTVHPPTGSYNVVSFGGKGGNGSVNGSFNGRFLEAFTFLGIEYLIGASILKAGWNLVTPKAETISVRVKPRSVQAEAVPAPVPASSPAPAPGVPVAAAPQSP
ncbi:MAG TPA: hypothetical protein VEE86_01525 [Thermoplasmata archaeon]|nr:hypothetical protein [Thermoplasmata archaeon]